MGATAPQIRCETSAGPRNHPASGAGFNVIVIFVILLNTVARLFKGIEPCEWPEIIIGMEIDLTRSNDIEARR